MGYPAGGFEDPSLLFLNVFSRSHRVTLPTWELQYSSVTFTETHRALQNHKIQNVWSRHAVGLCRSEAPGCFILP